MVWQVVTGFGRLMVGAGVLILLFVVYLLWGTDISAASHQRSLHAQFDHVLAEHHARVTAPVASPSPTVPQTLLQKLSAGDAPSDGEPIAIIQVARIGLDTVVVQGTDTNDLRLGPGHYDGTPMPGQVGNVGIAGHRTTYGAPFYDLNELSSGDLINLTTVQGKFTYSVVRSLIVSPANGSVLDPSATAMLTLTTCNPRFSASQRLVVQADLTGTPLPSPPSAGTGVSAKPATGDLAGTQGPWAGAALWGAAASLLVVSLWLAVRRRARTVRWLAYGLGALPMLVLLYFFFENVNSLLPASY
ncbi:MAG TPA: class E sortase [Acidimicrobiales bacterium]|nr:class E sortase [Acidimicrobiales bacterium]